MWVGRIWTQIVSSDCEWIVSNCEKGFQIASELFQIVRKDFKLWVDLCGKCANAMLGCAAGWALSSSSSIQFYEGYNPAESWNSSLDTSLFLPVGRKNDLFIA